jgi:hypothetical protein
VYVGVQSTEHVLGHRLASAMRVTPRG